MRSYKGVQNHPELDYQIQEVFYFITYATFNLAHWLLAFVYLVLSYQIELTAKKLPDDQYNYRLNALNIFVCLLNVASPLIECVCDIRKNFKVAGIAVDVEQMSLVLSCIVLILGMARLARFVRDLTKIMVNKIMFLSHIVAYLFIIVANIVQAAAYYKGGSRVYEIATIF